MKRKIKVQELRNLAKVELIQRRKNLQQDLFKLNEQRYSGRVDKPHMFSSVKMDIARIETILKEKKE